MARAKNTSRSEARRRTREQTRAEIAAEQEPEDGGEAVETAAAPPRRGMIFKWPDIRADLLSLPQMFKTRKLIWLPFILLAVGFVLALAFSVLPAEVQQWALLYFQYFFAPQALFTYFIGGFLATRASYMVGFILGALTGISWSIVLVANTVSSPEDSGIPGGTDMLSTIGTVLVASMVLGTLAAGFAGWYRDFLRGMQNKSRDRQVQREADLKAKRAADRQEARRAAKQKPAS